MVSNVLAAAAILRQHLRKLRSIGFLGGITSLGLIPLALYMPRSAWTRYTLLSLVCLYAGRKIVQFVKARSALKQLSMEEHFLRYVSSDQRVQKCVRNDDHLWQRSRTLAALKALSTHRLPSNLMAEEKRRRVLSRYRKAFATMAPQMFVVDIGLLVAITASIVWGPTIDVDLRAVMFQAGFLSLALAVMAEASHVLVTRHLMQGLNRLYSSLSDWTVRDVLQVLAHPGAYSHRVLYFAQPWFVSTNAQDEEEEGGPGYVEAGPGFGGIGEEFDRAGRENGLAGREFGRMGQEYGGADQEFGRMGQEDGGIDRELGDADRGSRVNSRGDVEAPAKHGWAGSRNGKADVTYEESGLDSGGQDDGDADSAYGETDWR